MTDDNSVVTRVDQVTPAWLTRQLSLAGALTAGRVLDVGLIESTSVNATILRLRPTYAAGSGGEAPAALLLKLCGAPHLFGPSEVDFYARDYVDLTDAPLVRCYSAAYDPNPRRYHLLLADVGATHRTQDHTSIENCLSLAESVAKLHAHRWQGPNLAAVGAATPSEAGFDRYVERVMAGFPALIADVQTVGDQRWLPTLRSFVERYPGALRERMRRETGFALIHGDLNPRNILGPIVAPGPVYLIDRQPFDWSLTVWLAASDLAYAIVHWWPTARRRAWERAALARYHATLVARGVTRYDWDQLIADYRLAAPQSLFIVATWCANATRRERMRWLWRLMLERTMAAIEDWRCAELWS